MGGGRWAPGRRWASRRGMWLAAALLVGLIVGVALGLTGSRSPASATLGRSSASDKGQAGTPRSGPAPNFTLTDQFGQRVSLSAFRGKVVLLAFNDPQCTTICPLTTAAMVQAQRLLGAAGSRVALLGVNANPTATQVKWVRAYSEAHAMMHQWRFVTGSLPQLKTVWHAYHIEAKLVDGLVDHTPALYVIGPTGREARLYQVGMAYSSVDWLAEQLAREASSLLPGRPRVRPLESLTASSPVIDPTMRAMLRRAGGGTVKLGPSGSPHLLLFFATWESELVNLSAQLEALNRYQAAARREHLPPLIAIDEGSVEPSAAALPRLLHSLPHPLTYPVAVDQSGRVSDGYNVIDEPFLEIVSASGRHVSSFDVGTNGWPSFAALIREVRAVVAHQATG